MSTHSEINDLWVKFQDAIDAAFLQGQKSNSADGHAEVNALADYTTERNPYRLANLLGRETANERQHRRNDPPRKFTVGDAAKLHVMQNAEYGSTLAAMPAAHLFLTMRQTAIEAEVIGYLLRGHLSPEWRERLAKLDYATLMQSEVA